MSFFNPIQIIDSVTDKPKGLKFNAEAPQVCSQTYMQAMAEGDIAGHTPWRMSGYTPTMNTTESDIWDGAGVISFPTAAAGLEFVSSDNTQDIGTSIFSGTATGGTATTLIDAAKDFTASTAAVAGDCIILEKSGASPEYGFITAVTATTLTIAGGFSSGGSASGRAYTIVDYSAKSGAQAVLIEYLDTNYAEKTEICLVNGTGVVATVNTDILRVNGFYVIVTGSGLKPVGAVSLRNLADTPIYSTILAGQLSSRSAVYTVPANKKLYVCKVYGGFSATGSPNNEYCRLFIKANRRPSLAFSTGSIFYAYPGIFTIASGGLGVYESPLMFPAKTDVKISGISSVAGVSSAYADGWIE